MSTMIIPAGLTRAKWERYVHRGRRAVGRISMGQFEVGDLVVEMLDEGGAEASLSELVNAFAHAIGLESETVRSYYTTARAWPPEKRRADVSFTVHKILASHPRRFRLIKRDPADPATKERGWNADQARRATSQMPEYPATGDERVERAQHLLRDDDEAASAVSRLIKRPEVAKRVVSDQRSRHELRKAQYEHWRQVESGEAEPLIEDEEDLVEQAAAVAATSPKDEEPEILILLGAFASFFVTLQRTIPRIHTQDYSKETRDAVLESVEKGRAVMDWCESAIRTGKTDMDKALMRLLDSEEDR